MKNYLVLIFVLSGVHFIAQTINRHEPLLPYRDGNLWGLCDTLGRVKVKPAFEEINNFVINRKFYGKCVIKNDDKLSVIDQYKKVLLPENTSYDSIFVTNTDRSAIYKNGKMGLLLQFKPFIPTEYDGIRATHNGSYIVKKDDLEGLVNSKGKLLIPAEYTYISKSNDEPDITNGQFAWRAKGLFVIKAFHDDIYNEPAEDDGSLLPPPPMGVQAAKSASEELKEKKKRLEAAYDEVRFYEYYNFIVVKKNQKEGVLRYTDEKILFPVEYNKIDHLGFVGNKSAYLLKKNGKVGIVLENKKEMIPLEYDDVSSEYDNGEYYVLTKDNKKGVFLLNTTYKPILAKYKSIKQLAPVPVNENWQFALFEVETVDGKKGIVGENGVEYFKN